MDGGNHSVNTPSGDTSYKCHVYSLSNQLHVKDDTKLIQEEFLKDSFGKRDELGLHESASLDLLTNGDLDGDLTGSTAVGDHDEKLIPNAVKSHQELSHSVPIDHTRQRCLIKSATFPCIVEVQLNGPYANVSNSVSSSANQDQLFSSSDPGYSRSVSLPTSLTLLSAMKGSREQIGPSPSMKLHVKWAPDVYDPPATLLSHTVKKSHQQRPKAKKKDSKRHKHKGKSSRGSTGKRTANWRSSSMPELIDPSLHGCGDSLGKSKVEVPDHAVGEQDAKCGSSFLREALSKLHISVGEAT